MNSSAIHYKHLDTLNIVLSVFVPACMVLAMYVASHSGWLATFVIGIGFSFLMLTNYALMHESAHGYLHSRKKSILFSA